MKPRCFNIRDLVLKRVSLTTKNPAHGKLEPNWEGPYRVIVETMAQNNKLGLGPVRGYQPIRGVNVTQAIHIQTPLGQRKPVRGGISPRTLKIRSKSTSQPLKPLS